MTKTNFYLIDHTYVPFFLKHNNGDLLCFPTYEEAVAYQKKIGLQSSYITIVRLATLDRFLSNDEKIEKLLEQNEQIFEFLKEWREDLQ